MGNDVNGERAAGRKVKGHPAGDGPYFVLSAGGAPSALLAAELGEDAAALAAARPRAAAERRLELLEQAALLLVEMLGHLDAHAHEQVAAPLALQGGHALLAQAARRAGLRAARHGIAPRVLERGDGDLPAERRRGDS